MKLYLLHSYGYGFFSYHGVLTEERYKKCKKTLKKKSVTVSVLDTDNKIDLRKLPNVRK